MSAPSMNRLGATPEEWDHFSRMLGLTGDLLPVVCDPAIPIALSSSLKKIGKTPSILRGDGLVVGLKDWTKRTSSPADTRTWGEDPVLGICLQTKSVRAIDIDIEDATTAGLVLETHPLLARLPRRLRANSGRLLLLVRCQGDIPKRVIRTAHGAIELLGTGQQCVIAGTHSSGARYEWAGGLPPEIPTVTLEELDAVWAVLAARWAIEPPIEARPSTRGAQARAAIDNDPVAQHLMAQSGLVKSVSSDGKIHIVCPWEHEHTSDTSESSTTYFPAHTGGYKRGHFMCQHAHCTHRKDRDFLEAIGYAVPEPAGAIEGLLGDPRLADGLERTEHGYVRLALRNVIEALRRLPSSTGMSIGLDEFRDETMLRRPGSSLWTPFSDADYTRLRVMLSLSGFPEIPKEMMRDAAHLVADEHRFDSARDWLAPLVWDGTPRVSQFLERYCAAEASDYVRAVSEYMWTAMAGRVESPGIKTDMVPILVGAQGCGKSTAVAALVPYPEWFCEISFHERDEDTARKMRGRLVAEIGELRGLHTRERESIKAFITRTHEKWIPKYKEFATEYPRRLLFIGTTNQDEFLSDDTGNRRWLPVRVGTIDVEAIRKDRLQLWAEARDLFRKQGVLYAKAEKLAGAVHVDHAIEDPWQPIIAQWLDQPEGGFGEPPRCRRHVRIDDVLCKALRLEPRDIGRLQRARCAAILRAEGYERRKVREGDKTFYAFVPVVPPPFPLRGGEGEHLYPSKEDACSPCSPSPRKDEGEDAHL